MSFLSKDLLGLKDMSEEDILSILKTTKTMKYIVESNNKKTPHLHGKSVITLFYENSTRTRLSFELASKYMGATAANISASSSSVAKGESLIDTGKTIDAMGSDVIIIRHPMSGAPHLLAKNTKASVINAGDGMNEHPTQALLDMFTIMEKTGGIKNQKVAIVGDIYHSRVARSNIWGLKKLGAKVRLAAPATLLPPMIEKMGVEVYNNVEEALEDVDVVMGLRIQLERQKKGLFPTIREYSRFFGVDEEKLKLLKENALILHPGPVNRGVEFSTGVVESKNSYINEQVTNGLAVRMALLYLLTRRESDENSNQKWACD